MSLLLLIIAENVRVTPSTTRRIDAEKIAKATSILLNVATYTPPIVGILRIICKRDLLRMKSFLESQRTFGSALEYKYASDMAQAIYHFSTLSLQVIISP